jgi:DNA mismatch endonuclease, patch repair protein
MADIVDKATRSRMMAGIRGKDTKPEIQIRRAIHKSGLRFRLHAPNLLGRPDIVLPKYRTVVFVHGCFWHPHASRRFAALPALRPAF